MLATLLGPERVRPERVAPETAGGRLDRPGLDGDVVATCCTASRRCRNTTGALRLTGQLGKVMKESARAAQSFVWSHAEALGIDART